MTRKAGRQLDPNATPDESAVAAFWPPTPGEEPEKTSVAQLRSLIVSAEAATRAAADAAESAARSAADSSLADDIQAEAATRDAADVALSTAISTEATTRAANDSAEATARAAADTTLQTNITAEASARAAADTTLQTNITNEATARANGDSAEATARDAAIAAAIAAIPNPIVSIIIPIATQTSPFGLSNKFTFRLPYGFTLTSIPRASLQTAQASGSILTIDIKVGGVSIFSTLLTVDNTEKTSTTAATAAVLSTTSIADDAEGVVTIPQIGDGSAIGLVVTLIGRKT